MISDQRTSTGQSYGISDDESDGSIWHVYSCGELRGTVHFHGDELLWGYSRPGDGTVTACYGWTRSDALEELLAQSR